MILLAGQDSTGFQLSLTLALSRAKYRSGSSSSYSLRAFLKAVHILRKNHPVLGRTCPNMPVNLEQVGVVECATRNNAEFRKLFESQHKRRCSSIAEVQPQPKIAFVGALFIWS